MSIHGVLGETTSYPKTYDPKTLYPIPRSIGRSEIDFDADKLTVGMDWWHAFEVSWLNDNGVSQVAIARLSVPANSPNIIESKSLKLYLNSLNLTHFADWQVVEQVITNDLSACAGVAVAVEIFKLTELSVPNNASNDLHENTPNKESVRHQANSFLVHHVQGENIDNALENSNEKLALLEHPDASLLESADSSVTMKSNPQKRYQLYSNLLRSNCPVTNQPDWGTVQIDMTTTQSIEKANLLKYILSYRQHNGFHEQCVEQIFADLSQCFEPSALLVRAWYTRRGGIDINPCRVSDISLLPQPSRLIRQ